jgi:hypothetical protein
MALLPEDSKSRSHSRIFWQRHWHLWEKSGMSQSEYCRKEGLALSTFTKWRSKRTQDEAVEINKFIEVLPTSSPSHRDSRLELVIPGVGIMRIPETITAESLHVILSAIKGMK